MENAAANDNPAGFIESLQGLASMCESYSRPGGAALDPQDLQMLADKFRDCAFAVSFAAKHREKFDDEIERLHAQVGGLHAAISWLNASFINDKTPEHELRLRVSFMLRDADQTDSRAALTAPRT
jgi:hypothetical protein